MNIKQVIEDIEKNHMPFAERICSWCSIVGPFTVPSGTIGIGGHYQDLTIRLRIGHDPDKNLPAILPISWDSES